MREKNNKNQETLEISQVEKEETEASKQGRGGETGLERAEVQISNHRGLVRGAGLGSSREIWQ